MNKNKITELGLEWKKLDDKYDSCVQDLIDALDTTERTNEKLEELKKMQQELYDLETQLFEVLQNNNN